MSDNTTTWQKYETKSSRKKATPKVGASGDAKSPKGGGGAPVQNGAAKKASPKTAQTNDLYDDFIEGFDVRKKKAPTPVKNGKVSKGGKNGLKIISGEALLQKGMVTSKFGEKIRFVSNDTNQAKEPSPKKAPVNSSKKPAADGKEKQQKNFKLNLSCLNEKSVRNEIESLKGVDQDKRCISLAVYLNVQKPHIEPPGWESASFDSAEPLKSVPKPVEKVLSQFVKELPESSAGLSFEIILAELITKMQTSSTTIWGYRVMLQILARVQPDAAVMKQHKSLSRLFANSSSTGTGRASAISWAVMQPYFTDPKKAMAIWCKILLPHISNKNLAPVICTSLDRLMLTDSLVLKSQTLSHYDYFHLLDYTFPQPGLQNVVDPKSHRKLQNYYPKFKAMSLSSSNVSNFFSSYLSRYKENQSTEMREELFTCITTCLRYNSAICYEMWFAMLSSYEQQSILFLKDFYQRQDELPDVPMKPFRQFLERVSKHLAKNNKKAEGALANALKQCKEAVEKKPQKKNVRFQNDSKKGNSKGRSPKSSPFSPFFMMLTLLLVIAVVELWTRGNQSYTKHVIDKGLVLCNDSHKWLLKNYPQQTRYVTERANRMIGRVQPIIANGVNWIKNNTPKTLDYIYKDGPVQAYTYFEKNIYPGFSKYFNKNVRPSLHYMSSQLNTMVDVVYASIDLSFLKPYLS